MTLRKREDEIDAADAGNNGLAHRFIPGTQMPYVRLDCFIRM